MINIILGHLVGDYLLQNKWMTLGKSKHQGLGWLTCFIHCLIYTFAICLFTTFQSPLWIIGVFLSHFLIDKFGIAEKYLRLINGRSMQEFMDNIENRQYTPYIGLGAGFTSLVYAIVDNTMHLIIMYALWKYIFKV